MSDLDAYDVENITGNFEVNYKIKKQNDNVKMKIFTRSDNNPIYQESLNRQGIGILFRKDFNNFSDLLKKDKTPVLTTPIIKK